jgi:FkbM family methyltransferase
MKEYLKQALPKQTAFLAYIKALVDNEIELRLLPWLCNSTRPSVDGGAFTGLYSIGASLFSSGVIAFEPQPFQCKQLSRSMPKSVRVVEAALSNKSGLGKLRMESLAGGSMSSLQPNSPLIPSGVDKIVSTVRLDDLGDINFGFIKLDVEGHEVEALEGAERVLSCTRPSLLIEAEERNSVGAVRKLIDYLTELDYEGFFVYDCVILPISEFNAIRHQDIRLLIGGSRRSYWSYINNFIFLPREWECRLPTRVPRAARAIATAQREVFRSCNRQVR